VSNASGNAWICLICGYVHRGDEPPETCPICGAPKTEFQPYTEPEKSAGAGAPGAWQCLVCGYVHEGPEPPESCPLCGALPDDFKPVTPEARQADTSAWTGTAVILGGGIAGVSAAEALRDTAPDATIILVSKEPGLPYYRLNLTRYLAGDVEQDALSIHKQSWYEENNVQLLDGAEATALDLDNYRVAIGHGEPIPFDRLILTCGSHPFIPPIAGATREGVSPLRTLEQADQVLAQIKPGMKCVCIGGGILGLETAGGLARRGIDVTVMENFAWLLPRQLNQTAARHLQEHAEQLGLAFQTNALTKQIIGDERARGVMLEDGRVFDADLVVVATGIRPNSYLARQAGLRVDKGIIVDSLLRTSHDAVFAAGDVAEYQGNLYGLWEPARFQGTIAGKNAAGQAVEFGGMPRMNTLKVLGLDMFSVGDVMPQDGSYDSIESDTDGVYTRFLIHDNRLAGAILLGDTHLAAAATQAVRDRADLSGVLATSRTAPAITGFLENVR